jgi:electron transport complex protein RnfG
VNVYLRLSIILALICSISAGSLALVDSLTRQRIRDNEESKERILRGEALAGAEKGGTVVFEPEPVKIGAKEFYVGKLGDTPVGIAFTAVTNKGYGGPIEIVIGLDETGEKITGARIKSHSETPGLGANAGQVKYGDIEPWFLAQFAGLRPSDVHLKVDDPNGTIDAITAATITSRAVTNCIRESATSFGSAWRESKGESDK